MKPNYILIDFENVQPAELKPQDDIDLRYFVFVGSNQSKVPIEFATSMQRLGDRAEYIQIEGHGKNALDFHIAFTIGQISERDKNAYFHIISKDTGFDPLLNYLKKHKISAKRSAALSDILPFTNVKEVFQEQLNALLKSLKARGNSRPRRVNTLRNAIDSYFGKRLTEMQLNRFMNTLKKQKIVVLDGEKISSYNFSDATSNMSEDVPEVEDVVQFKEAVDSN